MKTVLYADDSADDVFFMQRAFQKVAPDVRLEVVTNGREAIDYLSSLKAVPAPGDDLGPHLILLDLSMPITNGFEVLKWLRTEAGMKDLPVFVLTSSYYEADRERAKALGANGYLVKPAQPKDLADLILSCKQYWD